VTALFRFGVYLSLDPRPEDLVLLFQELDIAGQLAVGD
jgi:hypothetical protein